MIDIVVIYLLIGLVTGLSLARYFWEPSFKMTNGKPANIFIIIVFVVFIVFFWPLLFLSDREHP